MSSLSSERINIPAFQRKKELARKASKPLLWTAFDRQRAGILKEQKRVNQYQKLVQKPLQKLLLKPVKKTTHFEPPLIESSELSHYPLVAEVTHYLNKIQVVILSLFRQLKRGDILLIEEEKGLFVQKIHSMQINRKDVKIARKGSEIGLKVERTPRVSGRVYFATCLKEPKKLTKKSERS